MIKNYFKIAVRNLLRHKAFSFINITGLSFGLTCCLLLSMYLVHELSFDKFHSKANRVVRVIMDYKIGDAGNKENFTSTKVFPEFKRRFPEVESGVRMTGSERLVKYNDKIFIEKNFLFADSTFFHVFDFKLLSGTKDDVLKAPKMVVVSKSVAKKYFDDANPVGKTLLLGSKQDPYLVTGVIEDCPANSQIQYSMVASISSFGPLQEERYSDANYTTYLLMNSSASLKPLQQKINALMKENNANDEFKVNFELEPFSQIHLHSPYDAFVPNRNMAYIYIISGVALLILIIACFTYINLSTARSTERAKEVGIRKVSGAYRLQLFWQFISESAVLATLAVLLSFGLMYLLLPSFNQLAGTVLKYQSIFNPVMLAVVFVFINVIALLAGSYPAMLLSGFPPIKVLKGSFKNTGSGTLLRKGLIVFQFAISAFLIIATFIIKEQLQLIQNKKLGYSRDNVLILDMDTKLNEKSDLVKTELLALPNIKTVSKAYESPVKINGGYNMSGTDLSKSIAVTANPVDEDYVDATGLELIAGNKMTKQDVLDASKDDYTKCYYHFILNESAANALGWKPEEAIGKKMFLDESRPGEVRGVIKDFHFASLHSPIQPLVLFPQRWANILLVKTDGNNIAATITAVEKKWKSLAPHRPFSYRFMDDDYQKLYEAEMRTGKIFNVFAALAIVLACLGLFGLSAYAARQRIKEIGVRKVLGASVPQITVLLSSGFVKLVALAFIIATPVAWFSMHKWLQQFSYRADINWWIFIAAGVLSVLIAVVTVSFQFIKAAVRNPVKSLKTE
ncbi:MAG: ABC transporter permease [Sphingobacteriales bacterium]|nr:ABC transporter permease [Sphingobacteriales bacterium]